MTAEQVTGLIQAIASLIQALGWPLLVLTLMLYFGAPLKKFLNDVGEFTFKAGTSGLEATAKRRQIEAAALLGAASVKGADPNVGLGEHVKEAKAHDIAELVSQSVKPTSLGRLSEAFVLWVDDRPGNNVYERKALEALGIRFLLRTNTDDAMDELKHGRFDVIISDMGRPPDKSAGYTLLAEVKKLNDKTPFIIYAGSNAPEHKVEAHKRGAYGSTNDPQELFQLVINAIVKSGAAR